MANKQAKFDEKKFLNEVLAPWQIFNSIYVTYMENGPSPLYKTQEGRQLVSLAYKSYSDFLKVKGTKIDERQTNLTGNTILQDKSSAEFFTDILLYGSKGKKPLLADMLGYYTKKVADNASNIKSEEIKQRIPPYLQKSDKSLDEIIKLSQSAKSIKLTPDTTKKLYKAYNSLLSMKYDENLVSALETIYGTNPILKDALEIIKANPQLMQGIIAKYSPELYKDLNTLLTKAVSLGKSEQALIDIKHGASLSKDEAKNIFKKINKEAQIREKIPITSAIKEKQKEVKEKKGELKKVSKEEKEKEKGAKEKLKKEISALEEEIKKLEKQRSGEPKKEKKEETESEEE